MFNFYGILSLERGRERERKLMEEVEGGAEYGITLTRY